MCVSQCPEFWQVLEGGPAHRLDRVVVEESGKHDAERSPLFSELIPQKEISDPACCDDVIALRCGRSQRYSHGDEGGVPSEGVLWDGLDVVTMETTKWETGLSLTSNLSF